MGGEYKDWVIYIEESCMEMDESLWRLHIGNEVMIYVLYVYSKIWKDKILDSFFASGNYHLPSII